MTVEGVIQAELEELSHNFELPVPNWEIIPGIVSFYDHGLNQIFFSEIALRSASEDQLRWLIAHEYFHYLQKQTHRLQAFPQLREYDADRFATEWVYGEYPYPLFDRPTPVFDFVHDVATGVRRRAGSLSDTKIFRGKRERKGLFGAGFIPVWR